MATSVVVARTKINGLEYLSADGEDAWTDAVPGAQQFGSLREATRAAMRLPSRMRAFALPLNA